MIERAQNLIRRASLSGEEGMTVVEVLVAGVIMVIGGLAVLQLVDAQARNGYRAEQSQVTSNRLQEEMEKIKQLPFEQIALTGIPADTSDTTDPRWRVSGSSFAVSQQGGSTQPLVYNGSALYGGGTVEGGTIDPAPIPFTSGDVRGTIYRFVVWDNDDTCSEVDCPGAQDLKRVIVSVRLDATASGGIRRYQEIQTQIADPEATPPEDCTPPPGETECDAETGDDAAPWLFYLTDTPCDHATRQPITTDHLTHNTRGTCSTGMTTGNSPGAPDLMVNEPPVIDPESPLYDYATDVEPSVDPLLDKGLQLLPQSSSGCAIDALSIPTAPDTPEPDKFQKVHKWVSTPIPTGFDIELDGTGTLDLWTRTVNGVAYPGEICIWLFLRKPDGFGGTTDVPASNLDLGGAAYFTFTQAPWPTTWNEIHVPLNFLFGENLVSGTSLGIAIAIDSGGTGDGSQGLQFMYDEPSFDSRLEVKTDSAVPEIP
jgi:hypothetical protein